MAALTFTLLFFPTQCIVGVAGGATRAALTMHQARRNNMADVSAKDSSQVSIKHWGESEVGKGPGQATVWKYGKRPANAPAVTQGVGADLTSQFRDKFKLSSAPAPGLCGQE